MQKLHAFCVTALAPKLVRVDIQLDQPLADVRGALVAQVNEIRAAFRQTDVYKDYAAARDAVAEKQGELAAAKAERKANQEEDNLFLVSLDNPVIVEERRRARKIELLEGDRLQKQQSMLAAWKDYCQAWMLAQRQAALEKLNQALAALDLARLSEPITEAAELDARARSLEPAARRGLFGEP